MTVNQSHKSLQYDGMVVGNKERARVAVPCIPLE
jgi:hypothetical protein